MSTGHWEHDEVLEEPLEEPFDDDDHHQEDLHYATDVNNSTSSSSSSIEIGEWIETKAASGHSYWYNDITGVSTWSKPAVLFPLYSLLKELSPSISSDTTLNMIELVAGNDERWSATKPNEREAVWTAFITPFKQHFISQQNEASKAVESQMNELKPFETSSWTKEQLRILSQPWAKGLEPETLRAVFYRVAG